MVLVFHEGSCVELNYVKKSELCLVIMSPKYMYNYCTLYILVCYDIQENENEKGERGSEVHVSLKTENPFPT
jgi:hypothetical protein